MNLTVQSFTGNRAHAYKTALARLRIEVFREYPYLYDGSVEYEEKYLDTFLQAKDSIIVVAFADDKVVGVSTGIPLENEPPAIQQPWIDGGYAPDQIFYFSESVLDKTYRGQGIGVKFFTEREKWAKKLGYPLAVFCGVIRASDHPDKPTDYVSLEPFWKKRGFQKKEGYTCKMSWKEISEVEESEKELQFWYKYI